jgi:hypothetical protein
MQLHRRAAHAKKAADGEPSTHDLFANELIHDIQAAA